MTTSSQYEVFRGQNVSVPHMLLKETAFSKSWQEQVKPAPVHKTLAVKQTPVFSRQPSGRLEIRDDVLEGFLTGRSSAARRFANRRLKLLFDRCSKEVREGRIPLEAVNRLATLSLEILPLVERAKLVMPTAAEFSTLFNWYLNYLAGQAQSPQEPAVVLTTVCPDYPYQWVDNKAVFTSGTVGDDIGLIGESIMNTAPPLLNILSQSLKLPFAWIVGYAGFEAKPENLARMKLSAEEFKVRLETSACKLQEEIGIPVGILPDAAGLTLEEFNGIRDGFSITDFNIKRKGMDALADAVDARDWAGIFSIANRLNAIIVDGASVYMGRKAYTKAGQILKPDNYTPRFFCVCNYMGFAN
jgi:hypothetical protein